MFHVSSNGQSVEFISRLGIRRTYTHAQWDKVWPRLMARILS